MLHRGYGIMPGGRGNVVLSNGHFSILVPRASLPASMNRRGPFVPTDYNPAAGDLSQYMASHCHLNESSLVEFSENLGEGIMPTFLVQKGSSKRDADIIFLVSDELLEYRAVNMEYFNLFKRIHQGCTFFASEDISVRQSKDVVFAVNVVNVVAPVKEVQFQLVGLLMTMRSEPPPILLEIMEKKVDNSINL